MKPLDEILKMAQTRPKKRVALACPEDDEVLSAVTDAIHLGICQFTLFGDQKKIESILQDHPHLSIEGSKIVDIKDSDEACMEAVKAVSNHEADILMKGLVDTAVILKKVLDKEYGLRTDRILSHVMLVELPKFDRLIFLTDGAMTIDPNVLQLKQITINAVDLAHSLAISKPKVALISAVEKVNPKMPSSVKCGEIQALYNDGEISGCDLLGPIAIDIALDSEAANTKNISHPVAGHADILVVPFIEVGNALYKGWMFGCQNVKSAGIVMGAKAPIVLTSRADSHESKLYSLSLSVLRSDYLG